jgi:hypothetical protein
MVVNFEDCIIEMGPEAEIYIEGQAGVSISGSVIYSCDNLWRAIRVGDGGYLGLWEGTQRNHIQDAKAAVFAHDGATVNLTGTNFVNNVIGFYIPPPNVQPLPVTQYNVVNLLNFWDLTFECTSNLLSASTTFCQPHLEVQEIQNLITITPGVTCYSGVLIQGIRMLQLSSIYPNADNLYRNLQNGIVALYSDVFVQYSKFEDIPVNNNSYAPIIGYGIYANAYGEILNQRGYGFDDDESFSDVRYPIRGIKLSECVVIDNNIDNAIVALQVENCKEGTIDINNNQIQAKQKGVALFQNDPTLSMLVEDNEITITGSTNILGNGAAWVGIEMNEMLQKHNTPAKIRNNLINGGNSFWGGIHATKTFNVDFEENLINLDTDISVNGIGLMGGVRNIVRENQIIGSSTSHSNFFTQANYGMHTVDAPVNFILCNEYENLRIGHGVNNICGSSKIARNEFTGPFQTGLLYNQTGVSGAQFNTMNTWPGNTTITGGFEARHLGGLLEILSSVYEVHSNVTDGMPSPVSPNEGWFDENSSWDDHEECNEISHPLTLPDPDYLEERIALDSLDIPEDAPAYVWNMQKYLYDYLHLWPSGTWDETIYEDFISLHDTSSVGIWYGIEEAIRASLESDSTRMSTMGSHIDTIHNTMTQLAMYRYILDTATTSGTVLAATDSVEAILTGMDGYMAAFNSAEVLRDSLRKVAWEDLLLDIASAPAQEDWTESLQTVWTIYLEWLLADGAPLDSLTLLALESIAENCALTHGRAVYMAGSLRLMVADHVFHYECPESESLVSKLEPTELMENGFNIVPNPANRWLTLKFDSNESEGEIILIDLLGKPVINRVVQSANMELDLSGLSNGMYVVIWIPKNSKPVHRTLVINR